MALQKFYIGTHGPYYYDDTDDISDVDGDFPGETREALSTTGQFYVETTPTEDTHVLRKIDLNDYVSGPASATDNVLVRFDGATGKLIQDSLVLLDDTGKIFPLSAKIGGAVNYLQVDSDGILTLHADARVYKTLFFDLSKMKLGVGNPPGEGLESGFPTLDFDDNNEEETFADFFGPLDWDPLSDAEFHLGFFIDTAPATAANVVFGLEYVSITSDGIFAFTGTTIVTTTVPITTGTPANDKKIHTAFLTVPVAGLIEEGILLIRFFRDATNVADTYTGDARLFDLHIDYIANKLGLAL